MTNVPTNGELAFWFLLLIAAAALLFVVSTHTQSDCYIEDVDAWTRNYEKLQRRR